MILILSQRSGQVPTEELVNDVLNSYASRGDVPAVMEFFEKQAIGGSHKAYLPIDLAIQTIPISYRQADGAPAGPAHQGPFEVSIHKYLRALFRA